jgi:hypothetical protein
VVDPLGTRRRAAHLFGGTRLEPSPLGLTLPPTSRFSMDPRLPASRKRGGGGRKRQLEETCRGGVAGGSSSLSRNPHVTGSQRLRSVWNGAKKKKRD